MHAIIVVAGATGVGKTALGVELCKRLDGEIIGADSVQVYRGFDIGSSKPTPDELQGVPHHMLDLFAPDEGVDAARYAALADDAIASVVERGRVPIVVGGTGLWLRALLRGLLPLPAVDHDLRAALQQEWAERGAQAMHARLAEADPASAAKIHANDQVRVVRALEVLRQTGQPIGAMRAAHALGAPRYRSLCMLLQAEPDPWQRAIEARTHAMLERGWSREVELLLSQYGPDIRPLQAVGYRQLVEHLRMGTPMPQTVLAIGQATRLYAKRQRNWFRTDPSMDLCLSPQLAASEETLRTLTAHLERGPARQ